MLLIHHGPHLKNGINARFCPGDLSLIKRMLYSLSYVDLGWSAWVRTLESGVTIQRDTSSLQTSSLKLVTGTGIEPMDEGL